MLLCISIISIIASISEDMHKNYYLRNFNLTIIWYERKNQATTYLTNEVVITDFIFNLNFLLYIFLLKCLSNAWEVTFSIFVSIISDQILIHEWSIISFLNFDNGQALAQLCL